MNFKDPLYRYPTDSIRFQNYNYFYPNSMLKNQHSMLKYQHSQRIKVKYAISVQTCIYLGGEAFLGGGDGDRTFFEGEPFFGGGEGD